jgi:hypothetical protein
VKTVLTVMLAHLDWQDQRVRLVLRGRVGK